MKVKVKKHKKIPALLTEKQMNKNQIIVVDINFELMLKNAKSKIISNS